MGDFDEPFPGTWAIAAGTITSWQLRKDFTRVFPDVYVRKGTVVTARIRTLAAVHWAKGDAIAVGMSAAILHGTKWIDADTPAELAIARHRRTPPGITVYRTELESSEICSRAEVLVTTPARTAFDLGRRLPLHTAVATIDALCNATGVTADDVVTVAARHRGSRGLVALRKVLDYVDGGAESPQESVTRMLLVDDGLPRPQTQIRIRDSSGRVVARADLGWEEWKVAVEYDGAQHWTDPEQHEWDIERRVLLEALGWRVVHVSARLLRERPHIVIDRIRAELTAAGARI